MTGATLRIGLLGASRVATYAIVAPARVVPDVAVVAIAARDRDRASAYAGEHGIARVHSGYQALIDDPALDLVYIGTPPPTHAGLALSSIVAGKPVLVEKPFAMTAAEARVVLDAGRGAGITVFEAMHSLHHPLFARLQDVLRRSTIGTVRHLAAEFSLPIARNDNELRWRPILGAAR